MGSGRTIAKAHQYVLTKIQDMLLDSLLNVLQSQRHLTGYVSYLYTASYAPGITQ
jgi:hypothetical protein